ncbi:tyrosine/serine/threonine protein phosphatase pps1 [Myotisia sp. PD_48]|nr:tyrosine/serine/threonine protein phosphatase pps1 [Myotisia sp. PD_48]
MATVIVQHHAVRESNTPPPISPSLSLSTPATTPQNPIPTPIPNKHIPICPPGPAPIRSKAPTSPQSPPSSTHGVESRCSLYPPSRYVQLCSIPPVYSLNVIDLSDALDEASAKPLPDPNKLFPWLHGLHPDNHLQLSFFLPRRRFLRRIPKCLRCTTVVKVGGDLSKAKIKGAVSPDEILMGSRFIDIDPPEGFSVRNFHIQTAKLAQISDIVVYGDDDVSPHTTLAVAIRISLAQEEWRKRYDSEQESRLFNTFVLSTPFRDVEDIRPDIVAINRKGQSSIGVMDFFRWERTEMRSMSQASEISNGVWLGPTPDLSQSSGKLDKSFGFDILIETNDIKDIPDTRYLSQIPSYPDGLIHHFEFPSSGTLAIDDLTENEIQDLLNTIKLVHRVTQVQDADDADGDVQMEATVPKSRKVLIHCGDGYTESTLFAVAYFMFAHGVPVHEAWLRLHCEKKRNFFAYPSDVTFLSALQPRLLAESPAAKHHQLLEQPKPVWMAKLDGSLPSRILPYMYLGNLAHANNPELLWALGIRRVLSIGEPVSWSPMEVEKWGAQNLLLIDNVQDNGIDPLTREFDRCLEFIEHGKSDMTATLVHCRVGVSRSATICIAQVMKSKNISFSRAYCFVRARRLNVIIQPHLRFVYELLKWGEHLQMKRNNCIRRDLEWASIAREIALMNEPYAKQQQ